MMLRCLGCRRGMSGTLAFPKLGESAFCRSHAVLTANICDSKLAHFVDRQTARPTLKEWLFVTMDAFLETFQEISDVRTSIQRNRQTLG